MTYMETIRTIFKWIWRGFSIFAPIAGVLWGVTIYSGIAFSLWAIVHYTVELVQGYSAVFAEWANSFSGGVSGMFASVSENSLFSISAYVLSLDVPLEWFRSCGDTFLRFWLTYAIGLFIGVLETLVIVLGVMFLRSRLQKISFGLDGSGGIGGGVTP